MPHSNRWSCLVLRPVLVREILLDVESDQRVASGIRSYGLEVHSTQHQFGMEEHLRAPDVSDKSFSVDLNFQATASYSPARRVEEACP